MIIGTAGHIDHGKTTLVKALTGVDADRLKEEKERGITVDLGYAYMPSQNGDVLGFVDVPGHEKLVHNMLAGATGIDFVLLVIAADDGPMPQTREHLAILDILGLGRGAVALTKTDRVCAERIAEVAAEIADLLRGTNLQACPVFPLSALSGEGVPELREYLDDAAAVAEAPTCGGNFRLSVDRCFTLSGAGTVVTGTVFSGVVRMGEQLLLSPQGIPVRVRNIHAQNRQSPSASLGQRCALNLVGNGFTKEGVRRGDWILAEPAHAPTDRLDVRLRLLAGGAKGIRHWSPVHFHLGASDVIGRVALLQGEKLDPGADGLAQIVLDRPIGALRGDRFVIRDQSALQTLGGGAVLDPFAPARKRRTPERFAILAALERPAAAAALRGILDASPGGVDMARFARACNLNRCESELLEMPLTVVNGVSFSSSVWQSLRRAVLDTLAAEHREAPDALGPGANRLRLLSAPHLNRAVFDGLVGQLREEGLVRQSGPWLHLAGHRITLSPSDTRVWHDVLPLLLEHAFQPPRVRDLARMLQMDEQRMRHLMQRLAAMGEVEMVAHDHYFVHAAVDRLASIARQVAAETPDGAISAARFRDAIGTGRKLAIQILEHFDAGGLTRRTGDTHRVR